MNIRQVGFGAATVALTGGGTLLFFLFLPGTSSAQAEADYLCQTYGNPGGASIATLLHAYPSTAGAVVHWDQTRQDLGPDVGPPPSVFQQLPPSEQVAVCYYSGTPFSFSSPPPSRAQPATQDSLPGPSPTAVPGPAQPPQDQQTSGGSETVVVTPNGQAMPDSAFPNSPEPPFAPPPPS